MSVHFTVVPRFAAVTTKLILFKIFEGCCSVLVILSDCVAVTDAG
jgi:hypothetical protein